MTDPICAECGNAIGWQDGPYSNSNGGPWHRLCIPTRMLTGDMSIPAHLYSDMTAASDAPAPRVPKLRVIVGGRTT